MKQLLLLLNILFFSLSACKKGVKQQEDELYSRHLQRKVKLTIINTPVPGDKSELNLLLLNDGQETDKFRIKEITDSLYKAKAIKPLIVVAIHTSDRMQEFGVAGKPDDAGHGKKADNYDAFVNDELYPFIKKQSGVRKFNIVAIAGTSLGGLSAFDIGWSHSDKIDKVGVFSGSFSNPFIISKLKASRKKPDQQYWFYAGTSEENADRDKDGIIDVIDDTKDVIQTMETYRNITAGNITYVEVNGGQHDWTSWNAALPGFLVWAFGK